MSQAVSDISISRIALGTPSPPTGDGEGTNDIAAVLEQAVSDWNRGDLPAYLQLYDENVVLHGAPPGIEGVRSMYEGMWRAFPIPGLAEGRVPNSIREPSAEAPGVDSALPS